MCLWLKAVKAQVTRIAVSSSCPSQNPSSSLLVSASPSLFQSTTTRSTTWTARPSPRRHCTPRLFQNLHSRQAALINRSLTSITRVAETRATPLPTNTSWPDQLRVTARELYTSSLCRGTRQEGETRQHHGQQYKYASFHFSVSRELPPAFSVQGERQPACGLSLLCFASPSFRFFSMCMFGYVSALFDLCLPIFLFSAGLWCHRRVRQVWSHSNSATSDTR